jgi:hypothetical protein
MHKQIKAAQLACGMRKSSAVCGVGDIAGDGANAGVHGKAGAGGFERRAARVKYQRPAAPGQFLRKRKTEAA